VSLAGDFEIASKFVVALLLVAGVFVEAFAESV
jgi:hypothetical protein